MAKLTRNQRGLSESVQYAVIFPLLMLSTLGIIQAGLWIHGQTVAVRAANAAADAARGSYGSPAEARQLAGRLADAGGLTAVDISITTTGRQVQVTVTGTAPVILQLGLGRVSETATAPLDRVTQP
jgi:Flp pilus assembly protein TadG